MLGTTTTKHYYDGQNVVMETVGSTTYTYSRGIGLISMTGGATTQYYHYNTHGDTTSLTNGNGDVTQNYSYDAFGNQQGIAQTYNPFRYAGEYFDNETGFIYLRARYYDPGNGRFINEDPIKDGANWYVYCGNNPIMFIDPSGLYYLEKDADGQVYAVIESGDTLYDICYAEVRDGNAYTILGYADPGNLEVGQYVNITGIYNSKYPVPTNIALSKTSHTQGDSGLKGVSDEEVSRRARDKSLSGEERRRYQKEEKLRGQRNKQKRQSNYQNEVYVPYPFAPIPNATFVAPSNAIVENIQTDTFWRDVGNGVITVIGVALGIVYYFYSGDPNMVYKFAR